MSKKLYYMIVDTETATLPFSDEIADKDASKKKRIAIARPLVYDFGYVIMERNGNIVDRKHWLVAEIFCVPEIFNTAYYHEKRPIYLEKIARGEISVKPWNEIMKEFITDLNAVDYVGAYNSMFDFKKAIPFTELYIQKLYSEDFYRWEETQKVLCRKIANEPYQKKEKIFNGDHFQFRGENYPLFDLWGLACSTLLNKNNYKDMCLDYDMLTNSGEYFKTSAETSYRYLCAQYDFAEAHTALEDAEIEAFILAKILKRGAIQTGISFFPFQKLGNTCEYVLNKKKVNPTHAMKVYSCMEKYLGDTDENDFSAYQRKIRKKMDSLMEFIEI